MSLSMDNSNQATRINLFQNQLNDQPAGKTGQGKDPWREAETYLRSFRAVVALSAPQFKIPPSSPIHGQEIQIPGLNTFPFVKKKLTPPPSQWIHVSRVSIPEFEFLSAETTKSFQTQHCPLGWSLWSVLHVQSFSHAVLSSLPIYLVTANPGRERGQGGKECEGAKAGLSLSRHKRWTSGCQIPQPNWSSVLVWAITQCSMLSYFKKSLLWQVNDSTFSRSINHGRIISQRWQLCKASQGTWYYFNKIATRASWHLL